MRLCPSLLGGQFETPFIVKRTIRVSAESMTQTTFAADSMQGLGTVIYLYRALGRYQKTPATRRINDADDEIIVANGKVGLDAWLGSASLTESKILGVRKAERAIGRSEVVR